MFEEIGEPLRPVGRLAWHARRDGPRDDQQLPLDRRGHPSRPPLDHDVEAAHGLLEAPHRHDAREAPVPELLDRDDFSCHGDIMRPPSDTLPEAAQATRTEFTGASRSCTENHEAPPSPEPKTSPEVAPK